MRRSCLLAACFVFSLCTHAISSQAMVIVDNGQAKAVVVVADNANAVAQYAAEEFVSHVKISTGVELDIVPESAIPATAESRVHIGLSNAVVRSTGVDIQELSHDEYVIRTIGNDLYIFGLEDPQRTRVLTRGEHVDYVNESPNDGGIHVSRGPDRRGVLEAGFTDSSKTSPNGTLFGVYEVLDRHLGVRWLWPGESGTYVPRTDRFVIHGVLDEKHAPKIGFRRFAWSSIGRAARLAELGQENHRYGRLGRLAIADELISQVEGLTFSKQVMQAYHEDLAIYLGRHRLGHSIEKPRLRTHRFHWWWSRYGEDHPEWFMLNSEGKRGPEPGRSHAAMCVSNPDLHRYIVEEVWDGSDYLDLGEVDVRQFCLCENCKAWDGPQPDDYPSGVRQDYNPLVSDRYVRFWKTIQAKAAERNPNVTVTTFLYWNYFPAPQVNTDLNPNIYGEFTPWTGFAGYYPMSEEHDRWLRDQWLGWADTGIRLAYRPNLFHSGYVMPEVTTWQAGEFFKFAYKHGMEGFFFDSLHGHWAVRGPMLYMYMRLAWNPEADIEGIRQEYFSAFGPAAKHIEQYYDYWERYVREEHSILWWSAFTRAASHYPAEALDEGMKILDQAMAVARQHPLGEYAERVEFLKLGLQHAKLSAAFMGTTDEGKIPDDPDGVTKARQALQDLMDFRKAHEHLYIADLLHASSQETRQVDFDALLNKE